jgi:hypothetical protein
VDTPKGRAALLKQMITGGTVPAVLVHVNGAVFESFIGNFNWKVKDQNLCKNVMIFANFMAFGSRSDPDPEVPNHCGSILKSLWKCTNIMKNGQ